MKAYILDNLNPDGDFSTLERVATAERLKKAQKLLVKREKNRSLLAYALLEYALAQNSDWVFSKDAKLTYGEFGKPSYKGCPLQFSISHTKNAIGVAVSKAPIGIDVENFFDISDEVIQRVCHKNEILKIKEDDKAFFDFWTLKESFLKCQGIGISTVLCDLDFSKGSGDCSKDSGKVCKIGNLYTYSKRFPAYSLAITKASPGDFHLESLPLDALLDFAKSH